MGYIHVLVENILLLQDILYEKLGQEQMIEGEGNIASLDVIGLSGEKLKLKMENMSIKWAQKSEEPIHVITLSEDTFLDIISGEADLGQEFDLGHVTFKGENWLYHMSKWRLGFERMRSVLQYINSGGG